MSAARGMGGASRPPVVALFATLFRHGARATWARAGGGSTARLVVSALTVAALGPVLWVFFLAARTLFATVPATLAEPLLAAMLAGGQFTAAFFGLFYLHSTLVGDRHLPLLLALPLRPYTVVAAKFGLVVVGEWTSLGPLLLPFLLGYAAAGGGWVGLLRGIWAFLWLPVLPLAVAGALVLMAAHLFNPARGLAWLRFLGGLAAVGAGLALQLWTRTGGGHGSLDQMLADLLAGIPPDRLVRFGATARWLSRGVTGDAGALALLTLASAACIALLLAIAHLLLPRLQATAAEAAGMRRPPADRDWRRLHRAATPLAALVRREVQLLLRTPIFVLAAGMGVVMLPLLVGAPVVAAMAERSGLWLLLAGEGWYPVAVAGAVYLGVATSGLTSTAVSREGQHLAISQALPVPPALHVHAKLLLGALGGLVAALPALAPAAAGWVPLTEALAAVAVAPVVGWSAGALQIWIDLWRPYLDWVDPQQAIKSNLNNLLGMVATFAAAIPVAGAAVAVALVAPALYLSPGRLALAAALLMLAGLGSAGCAAAVRLADRIYRGR